MSKNIDAAIEYVSRDDEMKRKSAGECRDNSIGLGYRVPLVIASPWSRGGFVCSQVFDHTSPLQLMEQILSKKLGKAVRETNISQWRRTVCGDLTSAFQPASSEKTERLPFPPRNEFIEQIHRAQFKPLPGNFKKLSPAEIAQIRHGVDSLPQMPRQEPGVRPSCALPYELVVDGRLSADRRQFTIAMEARHERFRERSAGSPFVVYAHYKNGDVQTRNYAVSPGDRLEDSWRLDDFADGQYQLFLYGPNGFYREFRGDATGPVPEVICKCEETETAESPHRMIVFEVTNCDNTPHAVEIADEAYRNKRQQATLAPADSKTFAIDCERSAGWYDVSIRASNSARYCQRYAGRVETGHLSMSDPVMGRVET